MLSIDEATDIISSLVTRAYLDDAPRCPDPFHIAKVHGFTLQPDSDSSYVIHSRENGKVIYFPQDQRKERQAWNTAHELCESALLERIEDRDRAHLIAANMARMMLIPPEYFSSDWHANDGDLFALKELYPFASHELLAMNASDLAAEEGLAIIITIVDQPKQAKRPTIYRRWLPGRRPLRQGLTPLENDALQECLDTAQTIETSGEIELPGAADQYAVCRAWPVFEPDWKRVIIRTDVEQE